jgi:hypothetical protein
LARKVLPKCCSFEAEQLVVHILPELGARIQKEHSVKNMKGMTIDMDNARQHNSKPAGGEIERLELRRMSRPPGGPEILPYDFWLDGLVKRISKGRKHASGDDRLNSLLEMLRKITSE